MASRKPPLIIDFHVHVFPPQVIENRSHYLETEPFFKELYHNAKARLATAEEVLASMDQAGIELSVLLNFGWSSQELCRQTNDYILAAAARYPDRLVPFCTVQPRSGLAAVDEIRRCARAGAKGLGELNPDGQGFNLADEGLMEPLARALQETGLILLTHASEPVGHLYPGKGRATPDLLYRFVQLFPDLTTVFSHWGGGLPFYGLMPEVAQALQNVYFDTAASAFLYRDDIYRHVVDILGSHKILFGTDFPLLSQEKSLARVQALDLAAEDKARILGANAADILALTAREG
jgi:hypothetical protein